MQDIILKSEKIRLLILDVDGVLTDGKLFFDRAGNEYKSFHARDGHGIKMLLQTGVEVAIISGRDSKIVEQRMKALGVQYIFQGQEDKLGSFNDLLRTLNLNEEQVAYVGDDLLDLPVMQRVGFAISVFDANFAVKKFADWCTTLRGGEGAVREVCDFIMQSQGNLDAAINGNL